MPELSLRTMVVAIQAVDTLVERLRNTPEASSPPEELLFLEDCERAAEELKDAYLAATQTVTNSPPYAKLVKRQTEK